MTLLQENGAQPAQDVPKPLLQARPTMSKQDPAETTTITERTKVPIGLMVSCVITLAGTALWLNTSLAKIEHRLITIETRLLDRWTASDMRVWTLKLKMENPSLNIPEPENK